MTQQTPEEERTFHIREEVQNSLIWTYYQGQKLFEAFNKASTVLRTVPDPERIKANEAAMLRRRFEESAFVSVAYRPVRWLRLAVTDQLASEDIADKYLKHAENLGTVRHKREHFDEYIPFGKRAGQLTMVEAEGGLSDPIGTRGTGERLLLGNLVDVAEIMAAARDTHAALAAAGFWPDWQVLPFDFMDR